MLGSVEKRQFLQILQTIIQKIKQYPQLANLFVTDYVRFYP